MPSAVSAENSSAAEAANEQKSDGEPTGGEEAPSERIEITAEQIDGGKFYVLEPVGLSVSVIGLGLTEPVRLLIGPHEGVHEVRQIVYDRPETCFKTCFSIHLDGQRLDEFSEFASVTGLKNGSTLKLIEEPYTLRDGKVHVRRVRELLSSSMVGSFGLAYGAGQSPSLLSIIMQADPEERLASRSVSKTEKESGINFMPPDYVLPPENDQEASAMHEPPLTPLLLNHQDPKAIQCIEDITYSSWNPPPGSRKLKGDLFYVDVVTLDGKKYCITASPAGFYVNRSDDSQFNPNPAKDPCKDYTLIGLLSQLIPSFRKNFALLTKSCVRENVIEQCPSPFTVNVWVARRQQHVKDSLRADDAVNLWSLIQSDELSGQAREWNEEIIQAREMQQTSLSKRIVRLRAMFKWTVEFVATTAKGSCLAVDGNIYPLNPTDEDKNLLYLWNNVFFSYGKDSNNIYQELGGDRAAHVNTANDLKGIDAFNKIDVTGIYTVGTVIVDYRGRRVVAQNVIPGLLRRSQSQEGLIKHGSADLGKTVSYCREFGKLLEEPAEKLRLKKHKVLNEKDEAVDMHLSADCKGIHGTDGRYYLIDLWHLFPPDVNFLDVPRITKCPVEESVPNSSDEDDKDDKLEEKEFPPFTFPRHKHRVHVLRPELISNFVRVRYFRYLKIAALQMAESQKVSHESKQSNADHVADEESDKAGPSNCNKELQEDASPPSVEDEKASVETGETHSSKELGEPAAAREEAPSVEAAHDNGFVTDEQADDTSKTESVLETCHSGQHSPDCSEPSSDSSTLPEVEGEEKIGRDVPEKEPLPPEQEKVNGEVVDFASDLLSESGGGEVNCAKEAKKKKFKFVTASEQGTLHSNDPQTEEALQAAAKLAGSSSENEFSILFNPDVYGTARTADSEEVTMADRLLVQEAADHILQDVIPKLIKGMESYTFVPTDGIALSILMQSRGINMRYLGKITSIVAANRQLAHIFQICVLEMIARGVKHVFRRYLHEASLQTTGSVVAHLLNCLLGSCDSSQSPVMADEQLYGSSKPKKKKSRKRGSGKPQQHNDKISSGAGVSGTVLNAVTRASLWQEVIDDACSYFGYPIDQCSNCQAAVDRYGFRRMSLLRLVCKKLGFQILLRDYDLANKKQPPFTDDDILDVVPIVKHVCPTAGDTSALCEGAQARMHAGQYAEALGILFEAMNIYQQVYGAIHEDLASVFRMLARIHFLMDDLPQAISFQKKAAIVFERALGVDHPDTIVAYVHLGLYCHSAGQISIALRLMYRARYLTLLLYGEGHPDLATFDTNIGLMLHGLKEYKVSLRFLRNALNVQIRYHGDESVQSAMGYHLVARALANTGEVHQAIQEERRAFGLYSKMLGPDDVRTKGSRDCVKQLTHVAVEMQKKVNEARIQREQTSSVDLEFLSQMLHHFNHPQMETGVTSGLSNSPPMPVPSSTATIVEMPDVE